MSSNITIRREEENIGVMRASEIARIVGMLTSERETPTSLSDIIDLITKKGLEEHPCIEKVESIKETMETSLDQFRDLIESLSIDDDHRGVSCFLDNIVANHEIYTCVMACKLDEIERMLPTGCQLCRFKKKYPEIYKKADLPRAKARLLNGNDIYVTPDIIAFKINRDMVTSARISNYKFITPQCVSYHLDNHVV